MSETSGQLRACSGLMKLTRGGLLIKEELVRIQPPKKVITVVCCRASEWRLILTMTGQPLDRGSIERWSSYEIDKASQH